MSLRFAVGAAVMCNLGPDGWKLGRIIALHYREDHWPPEKTAPYQVALEDHALIYVPVDDPGYCREPTDEDMRIARRPDALAALPPGVRGATPTSEGAPLGCTGEPSPASPGYRAGRCHCCDCCPRNWSAVELYSEHYRCVARNGLTVTRRAVDLGTVHLGDAVAHASDDLPSKDGFMQAPTLVRLPPGVRFSDDGALTGEVRFDPHRGPTYRVDFVAVSTADWDDPEVGIVRLEVTFVVVGNAPPPGFDVGAFQREQQQARDAANRILRDIIDAWEQWELGELDNRDTCERMCADLGRLRTLLERHPRLDRGRWWGWLGGFHMNVHKLLENTLFECELYLGHALTFGDPEVRRQAEQNLDGCYKKRELEAARFMWMQGADQMMRGGWVAAAETMRLAAAKKDGWGWAVNYGDIWIAEAAARLLHGATLDAKEGAPWVAEAARLLEQAEERATESGVFGPAGHPWAAEVDAALESYEPGTGMSAWRETFEQRTVFWCAQVLGGAAPFPPKVRARREDAAELVRRLPAHND